MSRSLFGGLYLAYLVPSSQCQHGQDTTVLSCPCPCRRCELGVKSGEEQLCFATLLVSRQRRTAAADNVLGRVCLCLCVDSCV